MVNPALVDWVKRQEVKGYSSQQIYLYLVNHGYDQKDVIEAINFSNSVSGNYAQIQGQMQGQGNQYPQGQQHQVPQFQGQQFQQPYAQQYQQYPGQQFPKPAQKKKNKTALIVFLIAFTLLFAGGFYLYKTGMYIPILQGVSPTLEKYGINIGQYIPLNETQNNVDTSQSNPDGLSQYEQTYDSDNPAANCDELSSKISSCTTYSCMFKDSLAGMLKKDVQLVNGVCEYTEEMPNNGRMDCKFDKTYRLKVSQEYKLLENAARDNIPVTSHIETTPEGSKTTYTIDGVNYTSAMSEALNDGTCVVMGDDKLADESTGDLTEDSNDSADVVS